MATENDNETPNPNTFGAADDLQGGQGEKGLSEEELAEWARAFAEQDEDDEQEREDALEHEENQRAAMAAENDQAAKPFFNVSDDKSQGINMVLDIPVQISVELGRTKVPIKYILQLGQGSIVELDAVAGEPMDVLVNGYLIAQGEVVVVNDKFGIRLTDVVTPSERLRRISKG